VSSFFRYTAYAQTPSDVRRIQEIPLAAWLGASHPAAAPQTLTPGGEGARFVSSPNRSPLSGLATYPRPSCSPCLHDRLLRWLAKGLKYTTHISKKYTTHISKKFQGGGLSFDGWDVTATSNSSRSLPAVRKTNRVYLEILAVIIFFYLATPY